MESEAEQNGAARQKHDGPLAGVRILDLTSVVMGPYATMILANLGADVIKLESPEGDIMRRVGPMKSKLMGHSFMNANHGKRSVVLDLKRPVARSIALKIAEKIDVFVHSIRPNALKRLGLDYDSIAAVNPRVIFASAVGFGSSGRYSGKPAYDDLIQGLVGIPTLVHESSDGEPRYVPTLLADRSVGIYLSSMISAALYARERSGHGQSIEVPMFETLSQFVLGDHMAGLSFYPALGGPFYDRLISKNRHPYQTEDGYLCVLIYNDAHWLAFLEIIGKPRVFYEDQRFSSHSARAANIDFVYGFVAEELKNKTTAEWLSLFEKVDVPAVKMNSIESLIDDPHLDDVGFFSIKEHPSEGRLRIINPPETWSETKSYVGGFAPKLSQHTFEVLSEFGFSPDEIKTVT